MLNRLKRKKARAHPGDRPNARIRARVIFISESIVRTFEVTEKGPLNAEKRYFLTIP